MVPVSSRNRVSRFQTASSDNTPRSGFVVFEILAPKRTAIVVGQPADIVLHSFQLLKGGLGSLHGGLGTIETTLHLFYTFRLVHISDD